MFIIICLLWLFVWICICHAQNVVPNNSTRIKQQYGVNFDMVGKVVTKESVVNFHHSIAVPWPEIKFSTIPTFRCKKATDWSERCAALNKIIREATSKMNARIDLMQSQLRKAENIVSLAMPTEKNKGQRFKRRRRRKKRELKKLVSQDQINKACESTSSNPVPWLPTYWTGDILTALTNAPSREDKFEMKEHQMYLNKLICKNFEKLEHFEDSLSAVQSVFNTELHKLEIKFQSMRQQLGNATRSVENTYERVEDAERTMINRLNHIHQIDEMLIRDVWPTLLATDVILAQKENQIQKFVQGINILTKGYLSPGLFPISKAKKILLKIQTEVLRKYDDLTLESTSSVLLYKLKTVSYVKRQVGDNVFLHIGIQIPLYRTKGILPLYNIQTYPVPFSTGHKKETDQKVDDRFTQLTDVSDFIAVSDSQENYILFSLADFYSCKGNNPNLKICSTGTSTIIDKRSFNRPCEFLLFQDKHREIADKCSFNVLQISPTMVVGGAVQLHSDSTFLMHASHGSDFAYEETWRLSCPDLPKSPTTNIPVCPMCRIKIPCYCSLSGKNFYLNQRFTDCDEENHDEIEYFQSVNVPVLSKVMTQKDLEDLKAYETVQNIYFPKVKLPDIRFTVVDTYNKTIENSVEKYESNLNKIFENMDRELTIFKDKTDYALKHIRDMSNVTAYRTGGITQALKTVLTDIFGENAVFFFSLLFSPTGLMILCFILTSIEFIPHVIVRCLSSRRRKKEVKCRFKRAKPKKRTSHVPMELFSLIEYEVS